MNGSWATVGKYQVTGQLAFTYKAEWVLGSQQQLRVGLWSHPKWSLKT